MCQEISTTPLHHQHQQPEELIQGWMDAFIMPNSHRTIQMPQETHYQATSFQSSGVQCVNCSFSYRCGLLLPFCFMVVLCIQRCSAAHLGCNGWLFIKHSNILNCCRAIGWLGTTYLMSRLTVNMLFIVTAKSSMFLLFFYFVIPNVFFSPSQSVQPLSTPKKTSSSPFKITCDDMLAGASHVFQMYKFRWSFFMQTDMNYVCFDTKSGDMISFRHSQTASRECVIYHNM